MRTTNRRYRVKSKFRFITFLIITFGLMVGAFGFATGANVSTASTTDDYMTYTVEYGDTLWDIAGNVSNDTDPRKVVYVICQTNQIDPEDLQPGMVLNIPTEL